RSSLSLVLGLGKLRFGEGSVPSSRATALAGALCPGKHRTVVRRWVLARQARPKQLLDQRARSPRGRSNSEISWQSAEAISHVSQTAARHLKQTRAKSPLAGDAGERGDWPRRRRDAERQEGSRAVQLATCSSGEQRLSPPRHVPRSSKASTSMQTK